MADKNGNGTTKILVGLFITLLLGAYAYTASVQADLSCYKDTVTKKLDKIIEDVGFIKGRMSK